MNKINSRCNVKLTSDICTFRKFLVAQLVNPKFQKQEAQLYDYTNLKFSNYERFELGLVTFRRYLNIKMTLNLKTCSL